MGRFSSRLQADIDRFKERILTDPLEVIDREGVVHHEFANHGHGRKADFDKIEEGTEFYIECVSIYARAILEMYPVEKPDALVGVANGANRLARSMAALIGRNVIALATKKIDRNKVELDEPSVAIVNAGNVRHALIVEDVGTTGVTAASAARALKILGVEQIDAVNFMQRSLQLPELYNAGIPYKSVMHLHLPTFADQAACEAAPEGYCPEVPLIPHG